MNKKNINEISKNKYDLIIIGSGPAGMNCALYASRSNLKVLIIEKGAPGGKMTSTFKVDNWIGDETITGAKLSLRMLNHIKQSGVEYKYGEVTKIKSNSSFDKEVILKNNDILFSKIVVIASGMINRVPKEIEHIEKFNNKGVSYCVICDGPFNKGKPAAIVGGGNSAIEEAIYLSSIASVVYIFVKDNQLIAETKIIDEVKKNPNIKLYFNSQVIKLVGETNLEEAIVSIGGKQEKFKINALFPYIGFIPVIDFAQDLKIFDKKGFIITDENMETSEEGIFAIGDIRVKNIRQIITAAADGAIAAKTISNKIK